MGQLPSYTYKETMACQSLYFSKWDPSTTDNAKILMFDDWHKTKSQICPNPVTSYGLRRMERFGQQKNISQFALKQEPMTM
jgi:hypothetical protein